MKESGNIRNSWTKAIEKTVRKFCTTASRIKKDAVRSVKAAVDLYLKLTRDLRGKLIHPRGQ